MQASQIPVKMPLAFAQNAGSGYSRTVPSPSQITITPGAASYNDGFPPLTFQSPLIGGVPPDGRDFNGLLNAITAWNQWQQLGGPVAYDSTFQTAVGGYPKGAVVQSATTFGTFWLCTVDNNMTNPDSSGAGWTDFRALGGAYAVATGSVNAWSATPVVVVLALVDGAMIRVRFTATNTVASPTINVSSLGAVTIYDQNGAAGLAIGALPLEAILQYNSACSGWCCLNAVAASAPLQDQYVNSSRSLQPGFYLVDTSAGPITITLEASATLGDNYTFVDAAETFSFNNMTINPNGATILGSSANLACDVSGSTTVFYYKSGNWSLQ